MFLLLSLIADVDDDNDDVLAATFSASNRPSLTVM
jgi:hypothetical protein